MKQPITAMIWATVAAAAFFVLLPSFAGAAQLPRKEQESRMQREGIHAPASIKGDRKAVLAWYRSNYPRETREALDLMRRCSHQHCMISENIRVGTARSMN